MVVLRGPAPRSVLVVDLYHPELTSAERRFLEELEQLHRRFFPRDDEAEEGSAGGSVQAMPGGGGH